MSEIIITNSNIKDKIFDEFPSMEEVNYIKDALPNLKNIIFKNCVIKDFSLMEMFSDYSLSFINTIIEDYTYPICLKTSSIYFENTRINFERFFFMTDMPNLKDISLLYDSIEGVLLFKPYIYLLKMFPIIERIRLMMATDFVTYYDMDHTKVFEKGYDNSNIGVMREVNLGENLEFINYMPFYYSKTFDGVHQLFDMDIDLWRLNKKFWINPEYILYYDNKFRCDDLIKIREELIKIKKYGPLVKTKLGKSEKEIDYTKNPLYTYINLKESITNLLRFAQLEIKTSLENPEPKKSHIYGLFGDRLYDTEGHMIIVNERGSIISDISLNPHTKKLEDNLLPF